MLGGIYFGEATFGQTLEGLGASVDAIVLLADDPAYTTSLTSTATFLAVLTDQAAYTLSMSDQE